jgi:uncharacterized protein YlxW (UPF0749 family)
VKGEHLRGSRPNESLWRRIVKSTRSRSAKHRPRLGAMSTSLLDDLLSDHLDKGYAEAAARRDERAATGKPAADRPATAAWRDRVLLAVGLLLAGFLLAAAYRATAAQAPQSERARQALVHDVQQGSATSDRLQRQAADLSARLVRERDAALTTSETGDRVARQVWDLESAAALTAVRGPGITLLLGDAVAPDQADPATGDQVAVPPDDTGRLRDRDLQSAVNALWAAGAEAVSINGERLAPTTTIRAAGEAILVDLFPLSSPYTIEAIGNSDTLLPRFADSDAARRYQSLVGVYGIRFEVHRSAELHLRAATGTELRYAEPLDGTTGAAGPASEAPNRPAGGAPQSGSAPSNSGTGRSSPGGGS